jgi:hypothetical protein
VALKRSTNYRIELKGFYSIEVETEVVAAAHASPEVYTIVDVESIQVAQSEACELDR